LPRKLLKASAVGACFVCVADPTAQEPPQSGVSFCKEIYQNVGSATQTPLQIKIIMSESANFLERMR
jgi:hypothetical protein